jgi:hypothetical protein
VTFHSAPAASKRHPRRFLCGCLALFPLLVVSCAEVNEAGDTVYDGIFQKSRQRRIDKDTANLKAGRPLQYYHSAADLRRARTTGKD